MPVCPSCGAEFREGFSECNSCMIPLVSPSDQEAAKTGFSSSPRDILENVEKGMIPQPHLAAARELEKMLLTEDIPCYVQAEEADQDVALGSVSAITYGVTVARADFQRVQEIFQSHFSQSIEKEGVDAQLVTEAVDLDADEVTCPACGFEGALAEGACSDCGLFLGIPD